MAEQQRKVDNAPGLVALGGGITGIVSLVAAMFPFFSGDYVGAGLCLIAAALAFGLLANAVFRK